MLFMDSKAKQAAEQSSPKQHEEFTYSEQLLTVEEVLARVSR